ncbi:DUF1294 domain-containing protein [Tautonia plasticadhaerens]|uniref:Major cold shock protein CspA n=1 Tax=Tautonia plasticadhaerens TaxID=2527974 RepID=A0A518H921_9BACT|nr:cold shock and DUF1294 domain-containing protein [Tautonia plasticadhaerens]QDV37355.1 Major cold shock protein CspA [Tautonia plasticadhaerens]
MRGESRGVVVSFDRERGFGFIRSPALAEDAFVHASSVVGGEELRPGQQVRFLVEESDRGPRAVRVRPGRVGIPPALASIVAVIGPVGLATALLRVSGLPWASAWLVTINLATLSVWAWDKHRAVRDRRRVPESALLGLAALGGTIGAALGVLALGHKRRKPGILIGIAAFTAIQLIVVAILVTRP